MNAKDWLRENKHEEALTAICKIEERWRSRGVGTRKSWWEKLAGGKDGRNSVVDGVELPVLRAAQIQQGKLITANAIFNEGETTPPQRMVQERWSKS